MKILIFVIQVVLSLIFAYMINEFIMAPVANRILPGNDSPIDTIGGLTSIFFDLLFGYLMMVGVFQVIKSQNKN